eukprot:11831717-Prorocentrum_lima.AAC.1
MAAPSSGRLPPCPFRPLPPDAASVHPAPIRPARTHAPISLPISSCGPSHPPGPVSGTRHHLPRACQPSWGSPCSPLFAFCPEP